MRRVLSTVLAVALLLGLGALAVLALPGANASLAGAPAVSAAAPVFEPDAPAAVNKFNNIAMPLNAANQFTTAGYQFNADGLAHIVGAGVQMVTRWVPASQTYEFWQPPILDGVNFPLEVSGAYWVLLDSTASTIVSFVGDVPAAGGTHFTLVGDAASCKWNQVSLPLNQSVADANALATAIGNVKFVAQWNATSQTVEFWDATILDGVNFQVKIGYPYMLCMLAGKNWP